jgi:uncharacterized protein YqhQ
VSNQPPVLGPDGVARPYIGGQALIEGVMMRSPHSYAAVVRRKNGALIVREQEMVDPRVGKKAWPFVRGVITLVEALKLGSRSLRFSAEIYEQDLEEEEKNGKSAAKPSTLAALSLPIIALLTAEPDGLPRALECPRCGAPLKSAPVAGNVSCSYCDTQVAIAPAPSRQSPIATAAPVKDDPKKKFFTFVSILFAIALFVALPQAFAEGTSRVFSLNLDVRSPGFQLLTGAAKLLIVVGYMLAIRRLPEIYRVFQYHGAEHKSIYTYESGEALTVENARPKTTLHPRCGTTFLVMVALVSIVVFTVLGPLLPQIGLGKLVDNVVFFLMKLPFLPVIAAITFEIQRALARWGKGPLRALLWPGFLVQKITTIEPEDAQLEVALAALRTTLAREQGGAPASTSTDQTFESYEALAAQSAASPVGGFAASSS